MKTNDSGPLSGIKVIEVAGIGPGPMCGMLLADMGAEVLLLERMTQSDVGLPRPRDCELTHRGKRSIAMDLKSPEAVSLALDLIDSADVMIEGFRPGTMERIGLGPDICMARNERLIYSRMTGYGQDGPMSSYAGHDLNYISLSGVLHAIGRSGQAPTPPLNLIGDFAGGALLLAFGITCALNERARSGKGQIIDASMVEGASLLMTPFFGLYAANLHNKERGQNLLDSGSPFYDVYLTADGKYVAFGAIEHKFRKVFAEKTGFSEELILAGDDPATWGSLRDGLKSFFLTRTCDEWCALLQYSDACLTPVLSADQVAAHSHHVYRESFGVWNGILQPAPAPRFSRTPAKYAGPPPAAGEGGLTLAKNWGIDLKSIQKLREKGTINCHE